MKPVLLLLLCTCIATGEARPREKESFEIAFDPRGIGGAFKKSIQPYDPKLGGYRVDAEIATLKIKPRTKRLPPKLVLAIRTSTGMKPMLESLRLVAPGITVETSLGAAEEQVKRAGAAAQSKPRGTYLRLEAIGDRVHVTFRPIAMDLLKQECRVEWVDWYRG